MVFDIFATGFAAAVTGFESFFPVFELLTENLGFIGGDGFYGTDRHLYGHCAGRFGTYVWTDPGK